MRIVSQSRSAAPTSTQTPTPTPTSTPLPTPYVDDLYMESMTPQQSSFMKMGSKVIVRNVGNSKRRNNR